MMAEGAYAQEEEEEEEASSSEDDDMVGPSLGDGRMAVPDDVAYRLLRQKRALAAAKAGSGGACECVGRVLGWVGGCGCVDEAHNDSTSGFTSPRPSIHACTGGREEWMSMAPSELTGQDNSHMDRLRHTAMTSQKPRGFNQ